MIKKRVQIDILHKLFGVFLLIFPAIGFGTTYYVSSTGSDLNSGTSAATAWATISKVNSTVFLPGDTLYFEGGQTFNGNIYLSAAEANDPANIFVVSSYGTGKATINAGTSYGFYAYNTQGFSVSNLIFDGNSTATNTGAGILVYAELGGNVKFSNITISDCEVKNFGAEGVKVYASAGLTGFQNLSLSNLSVHDVTNNGIQVYGYLPRTPGSWPNSNVTVSNCEVYNVPGSTVPTQYQGNGIVISGVNDGTIQNCVAHDNGQNNTFCGGPVGIWSLESNNVTIQYCESYNNHRGTSTGCDGGGFDLDGGVTNSVMQYNYSHDNDGAGFLMGQYPNASVWSGNTMRYNISQNDGVKNKGSIDLFKGPGSLSMSGANIYNNTIYVKPETNSAITAINFENWTTGIANISFYNNIFITTGTVPLMNIPAGYSAFFAGNIYWATGNFSIKYQGTNYTTLAPWRTATGNEMVSGSPTGFSGDPMLTNVGLGGTIGYGNSLTTLSAYKIQSILSPAYHTALDLQAQYSINVGPADFWGTILPGGSSNDIGANQFVSILPTELVGFYGRCSGSENIISWSTAEELNMKSFDLMYSGDGLRFKKLVSIPAKGSYSTYQYVNDSTSPGSNYYQLAMIDMDGTLESSAVLNISCGNVTEDMKVWPNPFSQSVNVSVESLMAGAATMTIFDVLGKMLLHRAVQIQTGVNQFVCDRLGGLPAGTYYFQIDFAGKSEHFKLLKTGN
jgi:hypothetical protein